MSAMYRETELKQLAVIKETEYGLKKIIQKGCCLMSSKAEVVPQHVEKACEDVTQYLGKLINYGNLICCQLRLLLCSSTEIKSLTNKGTFVSTFFSNRLLHPILVYCRRSKEVQCSLVGSRQDVNKDKQPSQCKIQGNPVLLFVSMLESKLQ